MIKIHLPFPPSNNHLYPGKVRRFKSKEYELWIYNAITMLNEQFYEPITHKRPLQATYTFGRPDNRVRDESNYVKAPADFLVRQKLIVDDRYIGRTISEWSDMVGKSVESGVDIEVIEIKMAEN